jgi:hypothetical protein
MRRSVRRARFNARLYQAFAERETNEALRELYWLQAEQQRSRAARKLTSLFSLRARLPLNIDPLSGRAWRRFLILCGPRKASAWIEWREGRELMLIIGLARIITRLGRVEARRVKRPIS